MVSRYTQVAVAGLTVVGGALLWSSTPLKAQLDEQEGSFREAYSRSSEVSKDATVRLNYFGASWERVLQDVSKQIGRELVMDTPPTGRVTRRDRRSHTAAAAIRLLNAELEKDGFRLLLQRDHLVVLQLDKARSRYSRPVVGPQQATQARSQPSTRRPTEHPTSRSRSPLIRQTSGLQDAYESEPQVANVEPFEEQTFRIAHGKAADVARSIYDVFATRSTLNKTGVNGLPSFTVFHRTLHGQKSDEKHFEIGIDRERNSLTVVAPRNTSQQLISLIRQVDQPPKENGDGDVRVVQTNRVKAKTTDELQRELNKLTRGMQRTAFRPNRNNMFFNQNTQSGDVQEPGPPTAGAGQQRSMNLQGDVVLQPLDDLGAVVIKGNQADIDTVVGIIEELERLSEGTLPEINLVELKSVNSEALAELLTAVYDDLAERREAGGGSERQSNIGFVPVVKPNAILVLAPTVDLDAILELIKKLDRPVNPTYEFEVFQLRNAIASQVVASLETFYEEPTGLSTRIRAVADVRTNSVIVQARPSDLQEVAALVEKVDRDEAGKVSRVRVIKLRNAVAEELTDTINTALQNITNPPQTNQNFGQTGASELRDSQSVVLEFLTRDGDIERYIRSGILVDVRVQADIRSNSIIVTAPEASLELMEALIRELDGAPRSVADIKVFTLERASAEQAVDLLTGIFEDQNNTDNVGVAIQGAQDAESTLTPLRFSADVRTNSVVAAGSLESLAIVEAILLRLDETRTMVSSRTIQVKRLNNILAESAAAQLAQFLDSQAQLLDQDSLRSGVERLANEVVVDFLEQGNSLIISATPEWHARIQTVIDELDADPRQVVIQALIVEVSLDKNDEFGVELGFQDPFGFLRGDSNFNFLGANEVANTTVVSPNRIVTQGLSNFGLGRLSTNAGIGGFVFNANSEAVNVLIRALQARRNVQVLSRPMVNATNGLIARMESGQEVPVINGFAATGLGNLQPTVERISAGIKLNVTPRISSNDTIQLKIYAEKSGFTGGNVPIGTDSLGNPITSPIRDLAVAEGDIVLRNGQTAVFGGIITKSDTTDERKVPWLGDIPWLGQAFRYDATETGRTELLIFLTPRIVKNAADTEVIKQIEAERLHYIESDAEEVHGPIFSVPADGSNSGYRNVSPATDEFAPGNYPVEQVPTEEAFDVIQPTSGTVTKKRKRSFGAQRAGGLLRKLIDGDRE